MKRTFIKIVTTLVLSLFLSLSSVNAATKLTFHEEGNGNIKSVLHFEDGFIGGLDITLKVDGNINFQKMNLDSKLTSSNFTTKTSYDDKTKELNIVVVTGGVGTSHNLLNIDKDLVLGNILFDTSSKKDISYTIQCGSLTTLDNAWKSHEITPEVEKNNFTYKINSSENQEEDTSSKEESSSTDKNKEQDKEKEENKNTSTTNKNTSTTTTNNNASSNTTTENNNTINNDANTNETDVSKEDEVENKTDEKNEILEENEQEETKTFNLKYILISFAVALLLVLGGYFLIKKKKKNKI